MNHKENQNQTIKEASEFERESLDFPSAKEATHCVECGKPLGPNAIHYMNGLGCCNTECEDRYVNKSKMGNEIAVAMARLTRPLYLDTDISKLPTDVYYTNKDPLFPVKGVIKKITEWNPSSNRGMVIHGSTGSGKTRLITLLIKNLVELYGMVGKSHLQVFYAGELKQELSKYFGSSRSMSKADEFINLLVGCRVLIIDDFGKEKFTEYYETSVFNIIERRISMLKPTIITTNYVGNNLKERFSDPETFKPFYRRLVEFNDTIGLSI